MKPLFSEEEFDKAKTNDKLSCECEQCGNAFFKPKKDIQRVLRGHNVEWCKYCSNNCKYIAYGYRKYRIGKETGYKCK